MSRWWKIVAVIVVAIPILILGAGTGLLIWKFGWEAGSAFLRGVFVGAKSRPLTSRTFEHTPARLERGKYLLENLTGCFGCHSETNPETDVPLPGKLGAGKVRTIPEVPFPIISPNITPDPETGAGSWTDDMLARAIREGIGHDGRPLIPAMRYENYKDMSDEDLASVVVYLRSIPPVRNALPKPKLPFPYNLAVKGFPEPITRPMPSPEFSDPIERGEYLIELGSCVNCHVVEDLEGRRLPFAGGQLIEAPSGENIAASNLTPDPSGISYYDEDIFIGVMRTGRVGGVQELSRAMPRRFRGLTDEDLKAIFAYLQTVKPVKHRVDNTEPPIYCQLCGRTHGAGALNE